MNILHIAPPICCMYTRICGRDVTLQGWTLQERHLSSDGFCCSRSSTIPSVGPSHFARSGRVRQVRHTRTYILRDEGYHQHVMSNEEIRRCLPGMQHFLPLCHLGLWGIAIINVCLSVCLSVCNTFYTSNLWMT